MVSPMDSEGLISEEYRKLNIQLHEGGRYGRRGDRWADKVRLLKQSHNLDSILDYGCGQGSLKRTLEGNVSEYDPAIPGKDAIPNPADLVVCTDVLEHIEPILLDNVLDHLWSLTTRYLLVAVSTRPAAKVLADGRNAHLIVQPADAWLPAFQRRFDIVEWTVSEDEFSAVVKPKQGWRGVAESIASLPVQAKRNPIRALVFTTAHRTADNWMELFKRINNEGGDCRLVALTWVGDKSHSNISSLNLSHLIGREISHPSPEGISVEELEEIVKRMVAWEPEFIFLTDVQSYPSTEVCRLVKKYTSKTICIGLQHGFFQSWHFYNDNFCADHLFLFGDRHVREIAPNNREKCSVVGLPKLDRLKTMATENKGYLFYIPQRYPSHAQTAALLREISVATGNSIVTNNHPQFGGLANAPSVSEDHFIDIVARADWVMTSYSTGGIEALYLRKELVLLPSCGTTAWHGYPAIARDLTVSDVLAARNAFSRYASSVSQFLDDAIGGIRFDHTERSWAALQRLRNQSHPRHGIGFRSIYRRFTSSIS